MRKKIGYAMLAAPFAAIAAFTTYQVGVGETLMLFGGIAAVLGWVYVGVELSA